LASAAGEIRFVSGCGDKFPRCNKDNERTKEVRDLEVNDAWNGNSKLERVNGFMRFSQIFKAENRKREGGPRSNA